MVLELFSLAKVKQVILSDGQISCFAIVVAMLRMYFVAASDLFFFLYLFLLQRLTYPKVSAVSR